MSQRGLVADDLPLCSIYTPRLLHESQGVLR